MKTMAPALLAEGSYINNSIIYFHKHLFSAWPEGYWGDECELTKSNMAKIEKVTIQKYT